MDSFYTILLYVGALLLIGLVKSISRAGKKKPAVVANRSFSAVEEEKEEVPYDFNSMLGFLQESPVLAKTEVKPPKIKKQLSVLSVQNEEDRAMKKRTDTPVTFAEKETSFVFGDFDLPTAIVYSEILKKPDY
jgi:hypothetical protein